MLGEVVKQARLEKGLTQVELARKAECDSITISRIERGKVWPAPDTMRRVAKVLGLRIRWTELGSPSEAWEEFLRTKAAKGALRAHLEILRKRKYPGRPTVETYRLGLRELQSLEH